MCDNNIVILIGEDMNSECTTIGKIKFQEMFGTNTLRRSQLVIWNPNSGIATYVRSGFSHDFCSVARNCINDRIISSIIIDGIELRCFIEETDGKVEYCEFKDAIRKLCLK